MELAASAGLILDPWQELVLREMLGERRDGRWAALESALIVPRQNGKGSVLEALELAELFLFGGKLIVHTAHEYKTASEGFIRLRSLIENTDDLRKKVRSVRTANGEQGIELRNGSRLRFLARSAGSGRGFSGDLVILDEAYALPTTVMAALLPTMSARPNPHLVYASSAGDVASVHLASVRERALSSDPGRLCWLEWSVDPHTPYDPADPRVWAQANPALGRRIAEEFVHTERQTLSSDLAAWERERLGVWDTSPGGMAPGIIPLEVWGSLVDIDSQPLGPLVLAFDVAEDRSSSSIAVCGTRADGLAHLEVIDSRPGTAWVVARLLELRDRHKPSAIALDPKGPAGSLAADARAAGLTLTAVSLADTAAAAGALFDACAARSVRHLGQPELAAALRGAVKRPVGEAWTWSRRSTGPDISPLVACTVAFAARRSAPAKKPTYAY